MLGNALALDILDHATFVEHYTYSHFHIHCNALHCNVSEHQSNVLLIQFFVLSLQTALIAPSSFCIHCAAFRSVGGPRMFNFKH